METPSKNALKIADILLNGKKNLFTEWGKKTRIGIADLIDRETHYLNLLSTLETVQSYLDSHPMLTPEEESLLESVNAAIKEAKEK